MRSRVLINVALPLLVLSAGAVPVGADDLVEIRVNGRYYTEPATISITIAVEPGVDNRVLRVEADGERMFRSSDVSLSGSGEKRLHTLQFKGLPAGHYTLRAQVRSTEALLGTATRELVVADLRAN